MPGVQLVLPGIVQQQQLQVWQGQYPPPDAIERYEAVLPGAFDRMIRMAEGTQSAQIRVVEDGLKATARDVARGHWLGFITSLAAMCGAIGSVLLHQPWVAGAFLSVPVMAVARALVESAKPKPSAVQPTQQPSPPQRPQ